MSAADTIQLLKSLEPTLGEKNATDLISFIEEYKHENLATKADLKDLEIRLRKEIKDSSNELRKEIGENRKEIGEVRKDIGEVRKDIGEVRKDIGEVRKDMNANTWKIIGSIAVLLSIFVTVLKLMGT